MIPGRLVVPGVLVLALALIGCGNKQPTVTKQPAPAATVASTPAPPGTLTGAPAPGPAEARETEELRHDPADRDPFLNPAEGGKPPIIPLPPGLKFPDCALDELKLTAIVDGPDTRARAMFRGPEGVGKLLGRGQTLGKTAARIKAILWDRVVLQIRKGKGRDQQTADLVVRMHGKRL